MIPVSTSPVPAVASAGVPVVLTYIVVPSSTSVALPLSNVVTPVRVTNARRRGDPGPRCDGPLRPRGARTRPRAASGRSGLPRRTSRCLARWNSALASATNGSVDALHESAHDVAHRVAQSDSRSDRGRRRVVRQVAQILDRATGVALVVGHDDLLDQMRAQRRGRGRRRRDRDVAGAAARRAERAQHARAGKLRRARHDQRRAGAALVGDLRAARDQRDELFVVERGVAVAAGGLDLVAGDADIGEPQRPRRWPSPDRAAARPSPRRA